jgi:hypothetical protein
MKWLHFPNLHPFNLNMTESWHNTLVPSFFSDWKFEAYCHTLCFYRLFSPTLSTVIGFPSESDFEDYARSTVNSRNILAAIVFGHNFANSSDPLPKKVREFSIEISWLRVGEVVQ